MIDKFNITGNLEVRKMVTRSKTGSLTPKQFTDSVTMTTSSVKTTKTDDNAVIFSKDGNLTRIEKSNTETVSVTQQVTRYFKLGL